MNIINNNLTIHNNTNDLSKKSGLDNPNANPDNFQKMMVAGSGWNVLPLTENRRSVQRIIDIYSKIRLPGEEKIVSLVSEDKNIPVMVFKYDKTNISIVLKEFVDRCNNHGLQNCHILARGRDSLHKYFGKTEKWNIGRAKLHICSLRLCY